MNKTLFLGSSHVGAYKLAAKSNPDLFADIDFVGIPRIRFSKCTIKDHFLTFRNLPDAVKMYSAGKQIGKHFQIDLCAYSNIVLVEGVNPLSPELYSSDKLFSPLSGELISKIVDACLADVNDANSALVTEAVKSSSNLINKISSLSISYHLKSIRVPSPLPSELIPFHYSSKFTWKELILRLRNESKAVSDDDLHTQLSSFETIALKIYAYVNSRNTSFDSVVLPSQHLLSPGLCRTDSKWFSGSVDFDGTVKESLKQDNDFFHTNSQYAIEMMKSISSFLYC